MKIFPWQCPCEPRNSEGIPFTDTTESVVRKIDALLREQARLGEQIDAAKAQELGHFRVGQPVGERRTGRDRRRADDE